MKKTMSQQIEDALFFIKENAVNDPEAAHGMRDAIYKEVLVYISKHSKRYEDYSDGDKSGGAEYEALAHSVLKAEKIKLKWDGKLVLKFKMEGEK